jgi:hypothetical protein
VGSFPGLGATWEDQNESMESLGAPVGFRLIRLSRLPLNGHGITQGRPAERSCSRGLSMDCEIPAKRDEPIAEAGALML